MTKANQFTKDNNARTESGTIALALVVVLLLVVVGSMTQWFGLAGRIAPAAAPVGAIAPAAPLPAIPAVPGAEKPIGSYTARIVNGLSGAFPTGANDVQVFNPNQDPSDPTVTAFQTLNPNTATTVSWDPNEQLKMVYNDGATTYSESRFGTTGRKAVAGKLTVPSGVTAATYTIVDTAWPKVWTVSTIDDPFEEAGPTGDQAYSSNTEAINGTTGWFDRPGTVGDDNCFAAGTDASPADADTIFFNTSATTGTQDCSGVLRLRFDYDTGGTANGIVREPCIYIEDPNFNMSTNEYDSATMNTITGPMHVRGGNDVSALMSQRRPLMLYADDANRDFRSGITTTFELAFDPNANWARGEAIRLVLDDQCGLQAGRDGWSIMSNNTGSAVATMRLERCATASC